MEDVTSKRVTSEDGTDIAFESSGAGPPVVLVSASLQDRSMYRPLAEELAREFTVFNYDRRGRGGSGDTQPYAVEREIEDLESIISEAGGSAAVYGHSSGAGLVLRAAAHGLRISRLALHEPPYASEDDEKMQQESRRDAEIIRSLIEEGRRTEAVAHILGGIGAPKEVVEQMSRDEGMISMAHTIVYDSEITDDLGSGATIPFELLEQVRMPALILTGGESPDWFIEVGERLAQALPEGRQTILDGQEHFAPPEILAPVLSDFFTAGKSKGQVDG